MDLLYKNNTDWKLFFPASAFIKKIENLVEESWIPWAHTKIHLDIYRQPKEAPTIVYCHGLSSSGRMMANFAASFFENGFNVICPDLPGFGLTPLKHGSVRIQELTKALTEVVAHAKKEFKGAVFLTGISLGGTLSYYAAAHGAPVQSIACLNLLDLSDNQNHEISYRSRLITLLKPLIRLGSKCTPQLLIPLKHFMDASKLSSESTLVENFMTNPLVVKSYTLAAINSLLQTPPEIPFEQFNLCPVLVLHGDKDQLIPEKITRANFEKLKVTKKYSSLVGGEHVPLSAGAYQAYISQVSNWFNKGV